MGIKKKLRKSKEQFHSKVGETVRPFVATFGNKLRLRSRIRLLNIKAIRNPKPFMIGSMGILLVSTIITILSVIFNKDNDSDNNLAQKTVVPVYHLFDKYSNLQHAKRYQQIQMDELTLQGSRYKQELDSLISIKDKTEKDSVEIAKRASQLELIVKYLKENNYDED